MKRVAPAWNGLPWALLAAGFLAAAALAERGLAIPPENPEPPPLPPPEPPPGRSRFGLRLELIPDLEPPPSKRRRIDIGPEIWSPDVISDEAVALRCEIRSALGCD